MSGRVQHAEFMWGTACQSPVARRSGLKRVDTPLDELCVTLILASQASCEFLWNHDAVMCRHLIIAVMCRHLIEFVQADDFAEQSRSTCMIETICHSLLLTSSGLTARERGIHRMH